MANAAAAMKPSAPLEIDWDAIEEHEQKLDGRIRNWVRVTAERRWPSATCRSIEGRYRPERNSEQTEEEKRSPKRTQAELDAAMRDAWQIEDSWRQLPDLYKFTLQFTYLKREKNGRAWDPRKVWRKLGPYRMRQLRIRDYDEVLRLARFALANQLRRQR